MGKRNTHDLTDRQKIIKKVNEISPLASVEELESEISVLEKLKKFFKRKDELSESKRVLASKIIKNYGSDGCNKGRYKLEDDYIYDSHSHKKIYSAEAEKMIDYSFIKPKRDMIQSLPKNSRLRYDAPLCFISYAWGERHFENRVIRCAQAIQKAGYRVVFDRYDNNTSNKKIIEKWVDNATHDADRIIVLLTRKYIKKLEKTLPEDSDYRHVVTYEKRKIETKYSNKTTLVHFADKIEDKEFQKHFPNVFRNRKIINCVNEDKEGSNFQKIAQLSVQHCFFHKPTKKIDSDARHENRASVKFY